MSVGAACARTNRHRLRDGSRSIGMLQVRRAVPGRTHRRHHPGAAVLAACVHPLRHGFLLRGAFCYGAAVLTGRPLPGCHNVFQNKFPASPPWPLPLPPSTPPSAALPAPRVRLARRRCARLPRRWQPPGLAAPLASACTDSVVEVQLWRADVASAQNITDYISSIFDWHKVLSLHVILKH